MIKQATSAGADVVFLDLEAGVKPGDKEQARRNVIDALLELDWSRCAVTVRINALDTHHCYRDIVEIVEHAGQALDAILVPMVNRPADLEFVATLLSQVEKGVGIEPINLHVLLETPTGVANVERIAAACPERLEAMLFGATDYAAAIHAQSGKIGSANPGYSVLAGPDGDGSRANHLGDQWHYVLARMVVACRAAGIRPIDGPFGDFADREGFLSAARRGAALGCDGKLTMHPSQIALANEVFVERRAA
jgi:malyl-CoA/(S)-citramalyl-CoA lyase